MPQLPLPIAPHWIVLALVGAYLVALWRIDAYTPADVRHWRRLARLRGLELGRGFGERVAERLPFAARLRRELDVGLLLVIAGRREALETWLVVTLAYSLGAAAVVVAPDALTFATTRQVVVPLWLSPLVGVVVIAARYAFLRGRARRRQARIDQELADSLLGLAILVPGVPVDDALKLLARCQRDSQLAALLIGEEWARVGDDGVTIRSSRELYWRIGRSLQISMFQELSLAMRQVEQEGLSPREEYPALSRASALNRLNENRLQAARSKTASAAAIALLLVPLLILIAGGIGFAFLSGAGA